MNVTEYKIATINQMINTVLTGLLVTGICWLILEVTGSRERWARIEERMTSQSVNILELRSDINSWTARRDAQEERLNKMEGRIIALEHKQTPFKIQQTPLMDDRDRP